LGGIVFVKRDELRWRDAPSIYGPLRTFCKRWGETSVFTRTIERPAAAGAEPTTITFDAAYHKLHRTTSNLRIQWAT
jgi:hypothetical protein